MSLIVSLLFLFALFVAPALGLYAYLVSRPGRNALRPADLLASSVSVAAISMLVVLALTRTGAVGPIWSWLLAFIALALSVVAVGAWRSSPDRAFPELIPGVAALALVALIAIPAWVVVLGRLDTLGRVTGWFYWKVVQDVVAAGRFPQSTVEWGVTTDFFDYHLVFTALGAATAEASGNATSLAGAQAIRLAAGLAMPGAAYMAVRAWGAGRAAGLVGALLVTAAWVTGTKPIGYVPEGLGHIYAVMIMGLIPSALVQRRRTSQVALIAGMAAITQMHGIAGTFTYAVVCAALVAYVLVPSIDAGLKARLRLAVVVGLAALIGGLGAGALLGARASTASILSDVASMREDGSDPTWDFVVLATTPGRIEGADLASSPPSNRELLGRGIARGFARTPAGISGVIFAGIALIGGYGIARSVTRHRNLFVFATMLLAAGFVVGGGILLSLPYETYVPRRTGVQRLAQLWIIVPCVLSAVIVHRARQRTLMTGILLGVALLLWVKAVPGVLADLNPLASRAEIAELEVLPVSEGALVLTNSWTQGMVEGTTAGRGLLDGEAPYLNPDLLPRSLEVLDEVRSFLLNPNQNLDVIDNYGVDFVLIGHNRFSFGGATTYRASHARLRTVERLRLVFSSEDYTLYEVSGE